MRWLDGQKKACSAMSLELSDEKVRCIDRVQWRKFVNGRKCGVNV